MLPEVQAELTQHLVTIVIALLSGGMGAAAINWWAGRKKTVAETAHEDAQADKAHAEAESARINAAIQLLDEYQEDRARLLVRVDDLESGSKNLKKQVDFLVEQNLELKRDKERQDTIIQAYQETVEKIKADFEAELNNVRAELRLYKRRFERLYNWIRSRGLEPPTLEELDSE